MEYRDIYKSIYEFVEDACKSEDNIYGYGIWSHHVFPMLDIGKSLVSEYGGDLEVVELAILLHDIAGIKNRNNRKNHHIIGAEIAEKKLNELSFDKLKILKIQKCILNHRGSVNNKKDSIEEKIVADSDALAHIKEISSLYYVVYKELGLGIYEGIEWIQKKIDRDFMKMSDETKGKYIKDISEIKMFVR